MWLAYVGHEGSQFVWQKGRLQLNEQIRPMLRRLHGRLVGVGIDGRKALMAARGLPVIRAERREFKRQRSLSAEPKEFIFLRSFSVFGDRFESAGSASGHYFHQDLLVAQEIFERMPERHVDIGSSIYGFVSHVAAFREIEVFDIRPLTQSVSAIKFVQQDVMDLDPAFHNYADSVSCLHALEHFGLGRYGDSIDYNGWRKGLDAIYRMMKPGGTLYLSVPTGEPQRVEFNLHRVFSLPFLRDVLQQDFDIERLAFVDDDGDLCPSIDPYSKEAERSLNAKYGCSVWVLTKKNT